MQGLTALSDNYCLNVLAVFSIKKQKILQDRTKCYAQLTPNFARAFRACIAVSPQIHCKPSSYRCTHSFTHKHIPFQRSFSKQTWASQVTLDLLTPLNLKPCVIGLPPRTFAAPFFLSYSVFDFYFFHYFSFLGRALD